MPDVVVSKVVSVPRGRGGAKTSSGFYCNYLWDSITVLSDGNVTCGFDDPFGTRSYGNIRTASVREIFASAGIRQLREKLLSGSRCETCHLYTPVSELAGRALPPILEMPKRLILETTIRCQLRCRNTSCDLNNDRSFKVRKESFLAMDLYRKLMDELGPHLGALYFFNYGEPFLHPKAIDMLAYAKSVNRRLHIATSTNGLLLARGDGARRIVEEGLVDWINFTIAGCDDDSYQRYHHGGSFKDAFEGMRRVLEEKHKLGKTAPIVRWRYLLFNWNDSDEQIAKARRLAKEIEVDEFTFFLCSAPMEGRSRLRAPGQPGVRALADAVDYEVHYQADPFADAGLHPPEHDADLGSYCWTSREAKMPVMPAGGRAAILLSRPAALAALPSRVFIKTPWEERVADVGVDEWRVTSLRVPLLARGRPFPVTVRVDEVLIPFRHGISNDTRELGVKVSLAFAERGAAPAPPTAVPRVGASSAIAEFDGLTFEQIMKGQDRANLRSFVMQQYRDLCGREGDVEGIEWWTEQLGAGKDRAELIEGLLSSEEFESRTALVVRLYLACFHRVPDHDGLEAAIARFRSGVTLQALAKEFTSRGEFLVRYEPLGDPEFVEQAHVDLLGRSASASEQSQWAASRWRRTRRDKVMAALASSDEYRARTATRVFTVMGYVALAHRTPDREGFIYWLDHVNGGGSRRIFIQALLGSPEYARRFSHIRACSPGSPPR
jgi:pyruvate-formate lyase-activating enzyme